MNKIFLSLLSFFIIVIMGPGLTSCGDGDDDNVIADESGESSELGSSIISRLQGTSWKWVRNDHYKDGVYLKSIDGDNSIIKFSNEQTEKKDVFYMYVNGNRRGDWTFLNIKDGLGVWINWDVDLDAAKYGRNKIHYLSSTELIMGTDVIHHCFVSVSGNSGNGNSDGEAPNFVDFSYSSTSSSVTVIFHTDTDINGGTVYYGKNSPTTAVSSTNTTIGKHMVQATIKNLSKSTKYYVKCTVKNSYGTTTSDVLPVMTGQ